MCTIILPIYGGGILITMNASISILVQLCNNYNNSSNEVSSKIREQVTCSNGECRHTPGFRTRRTLSFLSAKYLDTEFQSAYCNILCTFHIQSLLLIKTLGLHQAQAGLAWPLTGQLICCLEENEISHILRLHYFFI